MVTIVQEGQKTPKGFWIKAGVFYTVGDDIEEHTIKGKDGRVEFYYVSPKIVEDKDKIWITVGYTCKLFSLSLRIRNYGDKNFIWRVHQ